MAWIVQALLKLSTVWQKADSRIYRQDGSKLDAKYVLHLFTIR